MDSQYQQPTEDINSGNQQQLRAPLKSKKYLVIALFVSAFLIVVGSIAGYFFLFIPYEVIPYDASLYDNIAAPTPAKVKKSITTISQEEAFSLLNKVYGQWKIENGKECRYFSNCFKQSLTEDQQYQVASAYGVIENTMLGIKLGLLKGTSVRMNHTGIDDPYLKNLNWYWEIGECSTNNRIYVDAKTGTVGPLHQFLYCTKVEEQRMF